MTTPQYEFADDSPVRTGRKHRRGRGYTPPNRKGAAPANRNASATSRLGSAYNSFRSGGHKVSSAASKASSALSSQTQQQKKPQTSYSFATSDDWDNANNTSLNKGNNKDDNSCTGSLTYSASSSVRSEESSNESSFADILSKIDSDNSSSEVKEFIQSQAASYGCYSATGGGQHDREEMNNDPAVQGYMQRQAAAQRQKHAKQEKKNASQARGLKKKFTMAASKPNPNVDLNYSKDDSSESDVDVFGVDLDDNILDTIGGLDDDGRLHGDEVLRPRTVSITSNNSEASAGHLFHSKELHQSSPTYSNHNNHITSSAPSSPSRRSSGHVTPPPNSPNSRHKRTSTPPGAVSTPISRTNSRHSKSSSDGSFDTPAPSSPPMAKPPHARSAPVTKASRRSGKSPKDETAVTDPSEALYARSWMCGFTDAFNFDGFDAFTK